MPIFVQDSEGEKNVCTVRLLVCALTLSLTWTGAASSRWAAKGEGGLGKINPSLGSVGWVGARPGLWGRVCEILS